jgi:hypothetical protein
MGDEFVEFASNIASSTSTEKRTRWQPVEPDQIDLVAAAMPRDAQQIVDALESGLTRQIGRCSDAQVRLKPDTTYEDESARASVPQPDAPQP